MDESNNNNAPTHMRVLMVLAYFLPYRGGTELQALGLARRLLARGVAVSVCTRRHPGLSAFEEIQGVPVYRGIRTLPWKICFGLTYLLSSLWFMCRHRRSYDIIHCHHLQNYHSPAAWMLKKCFGHKVIVKVAASGMNSDFNRLRRSLPGGLFLKCLKSVDRIITVCRRSHEEAIGAGFDGAVVATIPNGVDTDVYRPSEADGQDRIVCVGRLMPEKGTGELLEAFRSLVDQGVRARLELVGSGADKHRPDVHEYRDRADRLGIAAHVRFCGEVSDVATLLRGAAAFVMPSLGEGLPNALLEAMACGLPVVATRVGGIPDVIADGRSGLLVDAGDAGALGQALKRVMEDRDLARRLGEEARRTIEREYGLDTVAEKYHDLYRELMK